MKQIIFLFLLCPLLSTALAQRSSETDEKLADALERFPQADANKDGILTAEEARAFVEKRREALAEREQAQKPPPPTHADLSYGEHERHRFDLWIAESGDQPTPLAIYIHGGGFRAGDKNKISGPMVKAFLEKGISVASLNYRLTEEGKFPFPAPMEDGARALQTIRHGAEDWNIDPERIVVWGGSAGAGISLWLALGDERADPDSEDPVSRESTRVLAAGTLGGQSTYDMRTYREWFGVPDLPPHDCFPAFYNLGEGEDYDTPRVAALAEEASAINHLTEDDPPVYMEFNRPNEPVTKETLQGVWVHHPLLGLKLQEEMNSLGLECIVVAPDIIDETYEDITNFLIRKLQP